jgi:hypothetical protein
MVDISNWAYYKKINIAGQRGSGTNYQLKLLVGESSGSGTNTFHVEGHSEIFPSTKNNGGDLVFLANDNSTELSYWVESVTGTTPNRVATIWVKVSDDLSSNKSIYCYYGNSSATNLSDGENTFIFFDDFNDATLNTTKWNYENISTTLSGSKVGVGSSSNGNWRLETKSTFGVNTKMITNAYFTRTYYSDHNLGYYSRIYWGDYLRCVVFRSEWTNDPQIDSLINDGANYKYDTGLDMDSNGYGYVNWEIHRRSNGSNLFYINNTLRNNITDKYVTIALPIGINTYDANKITYLDYVCVAKFNDTEPSISSVESESEPAIVTFTEFSVINKPTTIQANKTGIITHVSLVTEVGYVYNTTGSPTISDNKVTSSVVEISGKSYINNVNLGELFGAHYVRAYVKIGTDVFYTDNDKYVYRFSNEEVNNVDINTIKDSLVYGNNFVHGVNDMLGNYAIGDSTAGIFVSEEGKFNGSYYVNNSSVGLITTNLAEHIEDKSLTFEAWMKIVSITDNYYLIGSTGFAFRIYLTTDKKILIQNTLTYVKSRDAIAHDNTFSEINDWVHVVFTIDYNTSVGKVFLNGVKQAETSNLGSSIAILSTIKLLFSNTGQGYIDTFYFYNRALSDIEVFRLYNYNNGVEFYGGVMDGCKAYFKLDNVLTDSTQNNNIITLQSNANFSTGKINQGILLNTTDDSGNDMGVKFNNSSTFISGNRQQSFGGWFKFNNISNDKYWVLFSSWYNYLITRNPSF